MDENKTYKYDVLAAGIGNTIDVSNPDTAGASGWEYDSDTKTITIFSPSDYTITGSTSQNKVVVKPKSLTTVPFNIILQNANISVSSIANASAFSVKGNSFCRILLYNNSSLYSGTNAAGIQVEPGSSLEIDELLPDRNYRLNVYGGQDASCIGANYNEGFGNITIKDIYLYLNFQSNGSGIGYCGYNQSSVTGGKIHIDGGETEIACYNNNSISYSAGILCDNLEVSGGKVKIYLWGTASGILFSNKSAQDKKIVICGTSEVYVEGGKNGGIGIGTRSSVQWPYTQSIVIDGGMVCAYGGDGKVGIGADYGGILDKIEINGGFVSAYGGRMAPGIGCYNPNNWNRSEVREINISDKAKVLAKSGDSSVYDIGDSNVSNLYSGLYSGIYSGLYSGEIFGAYQGRLSGLFQGEVNRNYTRKISCHLQGNYSGEATGKYSGLFVGRFAGYMKPGIPGLRSVANVLETDQAENN